MLGRKDRRQASSSPKVKEQTDVQCSYSRGASPDKRTRIPCVWEAPEERMFVVDSGASMHMLSKSDLSSDEVDTLRRSRTLVTVVTTNGEVQRNEEAQENVHDLDLFVTVQLLDNTPAVHIAWKALRRTRIFT